MAPTATSAIGNKRFAPDAGVSLVEAMVALMILGLIAGAVFLMAPGADSKVRDEAERLAARVVFASEESIIVNRPLSLVVTVEGYGFERLEETGWQPAEHGSPLGFRAWPSGIDVRVEAPDAAAGDARVARFDSIGGATPAALVLSGSGTRWRVAIDGDGEVDIAPAQ